MIPENFERVFQFQEIYANEFKKRKFEEFNQGDKVYLKNELKNHKDEDDFHGKGIVMARHGNSYEVQHEDGSMVNRHSTQLRKRIKI